MARPPATRVELPPVEPFTLGPTWKRDDEGFFVMPELTIGHWALAWACENLILDGAPFQPTPEQTRFLLWYYAIDETGYWLFDDAVLQRLKGWGKDPIAAVMSAIEFIGPCRFGGWATEEDVAFYSALGYEIEVGEPLAREEPSSWVQIAATAAEQTKNTAAYMQSIFTTACRQKYGLDIGQTRIFDSTGRRIEIVSSSPRTLEGNRPSFVVRNETHHWIPQKGGDELANVLRRNIAKGKAIEVRAARGISITNAYRPGEQSYGETQRTKYQEAIEKRGKSRVLYDSLEAPKGETLVPRYTWVDQGPDGQLYAVTEYNDDGQPIPPSAEVAEWHLVRIISAVRGDATWIDPRHIAASIMTGEDTAQDALRFYFNTSESGEDTYLDAAKVDATASREAVERRQSGQYDPLRAGWPAPGTEIVMFGDGSKSEDATGLVGCRLSDGYVFTIGIWQRPGGAKRRAWLAPRDEIDARVQEVNARFKVQAFWFDPSHTVEDETGKGYWDGLCDSWHRQFGEKYVAWAQQTGDRRSSVAWDMTSQVRQVDFVAAVDRFAGEVDDEAFEHDGHPALVAHMKNARNHYTKQGWSISKESRNSTRKIDLCVCAVGARMLRRFVLNRAETPVASGAWWAPV